MKTNRMIGTHEGRRKRITEKKERKKKKEKKITLVFGPKETSSLSKPYITEVHKQTRSEF